WGSRGVTDRLNLSSRRRMTARRGWSRGTVPAHMHVRADTSLPPAEVRARLAGIGTREGTSAAARVLTLDSNRQPAKLFLAAAPLPCRPAARTHLTAPGAGSSVALRLMWGPLPAPFPRAVAALGGLLALILLSVGGGSPAMVIGALLLAGLPAAALLFQRLGE